MKKLSIIIPHYNSVALLKQLIYSIPRTCDIEIIVVDDNSTEKLKELRELKCNLKLENVIFLTNETPINSAGKCRNIGLEVATGEWVLFADADDYFVEGFYDIVLKYMDRKYDVVFFSPTSVFIDTNEISDRHEKFARLVADYLSDKSQKNEVKLKYEHNVPWSKMIKRSLIEKHKIRFDEVIAMNDVMFSVKVGFYLENFLATNEVIYCVTRNKGSLTMMMTKAVHDSRTDALIRYYNFINDNLPIYERKYLKVSSINALVRTHQSGLGTSEVIATYQKFRRNKVKLLDKRFLNPLSMIKLVSNRLKADQKEAQYYKR